MPNIPRDKAEFREEMRKIVKKKSGSALISDKFKKDHVFCGHKGDGCSLAVELAKHRNISKSTLLISSIESTAKAEVLHWIDTIDDRHLIKRGRNWTISDRDNTVPMKNSYKFATVNIDEYRKMNPDDRKKKSRKYLKESLKKPKVACKLASDGTPQIYHLDY